MNIHTPSTFSCPVCRSPRVSIAEYEGIIEQTVLRIVKICPFLCQVCDLRFYMFLATSSDYRLEFLQARHKAGPYESTLLSSSWGASVFKSSVFHRP